MFDLGNVPARGALLSLAFGVLAAPALSQGIPAGSTVQSQVETADLAADTPRRRARARPSVGSEERGATRGRRQAGSILPPERPVEAAAVAASSAPTSAPSPFPTQDPAAPNIFSSLFGGTPAQGRNERLPALTGRGQIDALIAHHAKLNGVPEALVHRIVVRESKYNPRAVGRGGAMGLMQIKTATARGVGYQGGPTGLLDAETNITYAVKYLAGAYRTAGGNHDRAVTHYARGYYYEAKRQGLHGERRSRGRVREAEAAPATPAPAAPAPSFFSFMSGSSVTR